ncbi:hypothetical protein AXF42_Ash009335 [Apostasia shenzhenica]|uniref:B box-type domain-containing protein n=1 Tax=Apostasia shenzhenica TaxID=1088818 RepID=A0A2I0B3T5_9ASPA|nr:hypothetical protein AXF42_Ash009335 [Apostasia shenzhenica]
MAVLWKPSWLEALDTEKFFVGCSAHESAKKNEKNICCLDCCTSICPHCVPAHRSHRLVQVRRYVYHDVVRLEDLEKLIDCSNVQSYTINSSKVVFIKKRPQNRQFKGSGNICTSCDRSLQEPYIHCSLGCKVDYLLRRRKDLSPYLRACESLQLSPDFFVPHEVHEEEEEEEEEEEGINETTNSTIVEADEALASSDSDNASIPLIARKKRSALCVCARSASRMAEEDVAANMISRRKGIPQRSPLC